jgi:hypothetical protein
MLSSALSLLGLLHPDGIAIRSFVLGSSCPASLRPRPRVMDGEYADLIILAPTVAECRISGWLQEAVQSISQKLEQDGLVYILAPPRWRLQITKLLSDHGLSIDQAIIHLPDQVASRYLVPLSPIPVRYTCAKLLPLPRWGRQLAAGSFFFLGCAWYWRILPSIGLVIRRPGARPLFEWLFRLPPQTHGCGSVVIRTGWRGQDGAVILYRFVDGDDSPSAVAKMHLIHLSSLIGEGDILDCLGPSARNAGAQVPLRLSLGRVNGHPVLLQSMIGGQSIVSLLRSEPRRLQEILTRLVSWLESWNRCTMVRRPLDRQLLEKELLTSAALLEPLLEQGGEYRNWLAERYVPFTGASVPLVATHNDLTMWNLLLGEEGRLGVIDWEFACERGLPFVDFFYAVTDAVTATLGYDDRLKAFQECFALDGTHARMVGQFLTQLRRVVQIPDEIVDLCFHACWLHHAANECRSTGPSDRRPFLKLVQWLALNRSYVSKWVHG